jgi:hypothetical protein
MAFNGNRTGKSIELTKGFSITMVDSQTVNELESPLLIVKSHYIPLIQRVFCVS